MIELLKENAARFNSLIYFKEDPVIFPRHFAALMSEGKASLADVEIAGIIAAHLAWGRRAIIVRDCNRAMDEMHWQPYDYVMAGNYRDEDRSLHRTVKWSDFANICTNLKAFYSNNNSLERLTTEEIRTLIYGQKPDKNAPNKKINMFRRWMVRRDGIVDLGLWQDTSPADLIIPLDVHVHRMALEYGLTTRRQPDARTALEITAALSEIFPGDPCLGDFALFGKGVSSDSSTNREDCRMFMA